MGENDVETFYIEIGGIEIETREFKSSVYQYLGYRVNVYYTDVRGDIPRLIHIVKTAGNSENEIDVSDIESFANGKIEVYNEEEGRRQTYSYNRSIPVVYNGVSTKQTFSQDLIDGMQGTIILLDNTGDKSPDVAFVNVYETIVVAQVDSDEYIVYDAYDVTHKVKLDTTVDDPFTTIYNADGEESNISGIRAGDALAVFSSAPDAYQQYINAYIVRRTASGTIERVKESGKKVIIGGVEYEFTDQCRQKFSELIKAGQEVELTLDYGGLVCYVKNGGTSMQYGYLAVASYEGGGLTGELKFMIYPANGVDLMIYDAADTMNIDGNRYKPDDDFEDGTIISRLEDACKALYSDASAGDTCSMIRYSLNADSEVTAIDTVLTGEGDTATRMDAISADDCLFYSYSNTDHYKRNNYTIGPKISFTNTTPIMFVPGPDRDVMDADLYTIGTENILAHNKQYTTGVMGFYTDSENYLADVVACIYADGLFDNAMENSPTSVVEEVNPQSTLSNVDGKIYDSVTFAGAGSVLVKPGFTFKGYHMEPKKDENGNVMTDENGNAIMEEVFNGNATVADLRPGDFVRYAVDKDGFLVSLTMYFSPSRGKSSTDGVNTAYRSGFRIIYGYVYDKFDNGMLAYVSTKAEELGGKDVLKIEGANTYDVIMSKCELVMNTGGSPTYYIYEVDENGEADIRTTTFDGLKSYLDTENDCSRFVMQQNYGTPITVMVY